MDSEDDAKDTLLYLRMKKRLFRGQSVKGRLKSETVVRSFFPVQAAPSMPPAIYPGMQMQYAGGFVPGPMPIDMRYGYGMGPMGGMMPNMGGMMPPPVPMGEMLTHVPVNVPASSSQDEQEMKSGSPSQSTKGERRAPYTGAAASLVPQGPGGSSSAAAGSYKGAATGSGPTGTTRDSAPRDRNSKVSGTDRQTGRQTCLDLI